MQSAGPDDQATPTPLSPAATVVILRDGPDGIEALMVRRNTKLAFAGGSWVFPGGRVEEADHDGLDDDDHLGAAQRAAVREAAEETGVELDPASLVWFSHWTPPPSAPRRYATFFFAARTPGHDLDVTVDGSEIHDWAWMTAAGALVGRDRGEIELHPPTWISLEHLRQHATVDDALAAFTVAEPEHFATRIVVDGTRVIAVYHGDAGYETVDADARGGRHRLVMADDGWSYERDGWPPSGSADPPSQ